MRKPRLSALALADSTLEAANLQVRSAELGNWPSFGPYVAAQNMRQLNADDGLSNGAIGVTFKWNLPGQKGKFNYDSARAAAEASRLALINALADLRSKVSSLNQQIEAQKNILGVLDRSVANSRELVMTLNIQRKIGIVDSLNYTQAYVNMINSIHARLDSWDTFEKSAFQLAQYKSANAIVDEITGTTKR